MRPVGASPEQQVASLLKIEKGRKTHQLFCWEGGDSCARTDERLCAGQGSIPPALPARSDTALCASLRQSVRGRDEDAEVGGGSTGAAAAGGGQRGRGGLTLLFLTAAFICRK